jgi:hypothetical protein
VPVEIDKECEPIPFSAYTEPFEQVFTEGAHPRELTKKEESTGWGYVERKAKGAKRRRKRLMGKKAKDDGEEEGGASTSIVRVWLKGGQHKSGQRVASKITKPVKHTSNEKMLTWRAMPNLASYDIMANPKYGRLLVDCPYFDEEKIRKLMARKAKAERARVKAEGQATKGTPEEQLKAMTELKVDPLMAKKKAKAEMKAAKYKTVSTFGLLWYETKPSNLALTALTIHQMMGGSKIVPDLMSLGGGSDPEGPLAFSFEESIGLAKRPPPEERE